MAVVQFGFSADHYVLHKLEELCSLSGERPRDVVEQAIKEAIAEFETRERMPENGYHRSWAFRDTAIPTEDPLLVRIGLAFFGKFQKRAFDVAINRYLWEKVIERRHRLLRQPPSH